MTPCQECARMTVKLFSAESDRDRYKRLSITYWGALYDIADPNNHLNLTADEMRDRARKAMEDNA